MRKSLIVLLCGLSAATVVGVGLTVPVGAATALPVYHPSRLAHVGDSKQLIVVTGRGKTSSYSTLRAFDLGADGKWRQKFPAMAARNGWHGWVVGSKRVQNTGTTPQGTYRITTAFGLSANPGTKLSYRHADGNDYWVGDQRDPKTYNMVQPSASAHRTWRNTADTAERLAAYPVQYQYAAVIDFNRPVATSITWSSRYSEWVTSKPVNVKLGSAIFLHITGKGSTAGCVSLKKADLVSVLRWIDPAMTPRIVMAPESEIGKA
jgi:L,D-peptidoglycan transpeptidase YkuD (ErfK/YbiS/YcfS/YnhG family)